MQATYGNQGERDCSYFEPTNLFNLQCPYFDLINPQTNQHQIPFWIQLKIHYCFPWKFRSQKWATTTFLNVNFSITRSNMICFFSIWYVYETNNVIRELLIQSQRLLSVCTLCIKVNETEEQGINKEKGILV